MKKINSIMLLFVCLLCFTSCSTWSKKDWDSLQDRTFHFKSLKYTKNRQKKEVAFKRMQNFPTENIFKLLSHKYNIKIDTNEFDKFISTADESVLKTRGLLFDAEFTWMCNSDFKNYIEIEFGENITAGNQQPSTEEYKINIFTEGKIRMSTASKIPYYLSIAQVIPEDLGFKKINDSIYLFKKSGEEIDLNKINYRPDENRENFVTKEEYAAEGALISPDKIKENINEFISGKSIDEKKKFRDDLIKYLYMIIE